MHNFEEEKIKRLTKVNLINNSQKNILVFLLKNCSQFRIRKVIKKFVDWCDDFYTYSNTNFILKDKDIKI